MIGAEFFRIKTMKIKEIVIVTLVLVGSISGAAAADTKAVITELSSRTSDRQLLDEAWFYRTA
jgi:hypothetical protein